ncbi:SDR family oxidoreductase [Mycolicibacterium goodii]|uniref:SDR family oxidoreductase n=1 Tax=Mycolicibacterium goodii TaxID=134601 RepID=A0ABS6HV92_MYCGD|nr:SDR family oxidoreductase [Mycolicibacterium goodii]MBU8826606.1 SDR family oxidoreductase [Mycolicibacterium goodii]MBU8840024.1 SDR family oxidoreductase [Mycolicibacterium goodii]OKH65986.1 NAD-dependent dehydratase [Mycobacterium sp. SWH-M5]
MSSNSASVALVAGSGGVIGRNVIERFVTSGIRTRGVSRRAPASTGGWEHLAADLLDPESTRTAFAAAADTTRLVFAAYIEKADPVAQIEVNSALLANVLDGLRDAGAPLQHVTLYQGMKYYGAHLGNFKTPAREDDPRLIVPNFYYAQEDILRERAAKDGFAFTLLRPEAVIGYATGNPMNLLMALAAYVAITKELGIPLRFPGTRVGYDQVFYQMSDAELLARATEWAADSPSAHGEAFNLTNGDVIRWRHVFEAIAEHYGLAVAEPQPMRLTEQMPQYAALWDTIVAKHGLQPTPWAQLVDWKFGDAILGSESDNVSSTIKIRQAGFTGCFDTIDRTLELLDQLAEQRIIPSAK